MRLDLDVNLNKSKDEIEIDKLILEIKESFKKMHNLYKVLTYTIFGKEYDFYDDKVVNYKDILSLNGLEFCVRGHGYSEAFFITYKKPSKFLWFKKRKYFWCVRGCTFHSEYTRDDRYNFTVDDYRKILNVLENECGILKFGIEYYQKKKNGVLT